MTRPAAACPNCGAPVAFRWSSSVQTTCDHCRSILVRTDLNLERVGVVADLPPDNSPIQIGTEGKYKQRTFTVAGRILYEYADGYWNEWHIVMNDGRTAWLSDAQSQYALTFPVVGLQLPAVSAVAIGNHYTWQNTDFVATTITLARYRGVQGELPFQSWDKKDATFVDFLSANGSFATLDYSDASPALYLGEITDFDSLGLRNLRQFEGWS